MDKIDRKIISILQENGRVSNQELAERVNLSPSPCLRRVKQLEASGVIQGYSADISAEACGLPITVFARVQLDKHSTDVVNRFEQSIRQTDQVLECFVMTGRSDYLLKIIVKDLHDYESFVRQKLHAIGNIATIDTSFAYGTVKSTKTLPIIAYNRME